MAANFIPNLGREIFTKIPTAKVKRAMPQHPFTPILCARAAELVPFALWIATGARMRPIRMIMGPVTWGGRILWMVS